MISRRRFLELGTLAGASFLVPKLLKSFEHNAATGNRKLVVIELSGGNDGLNTVVPFQNDFYYRSRPTIALQKREVLRLSDEAGFHPALIGLKTLYDEGDVAIVNNVGYSSHSRSHYRSMDIWHTAATEGKLKSGWLGRYMDILSARENSVCEIDKTASIAVTGKYRKANLMSCTDAYSTNNKTYPDTQIGRKLKTIANAMRSKSPAKVYYLAHGSFDTHVNQKDHQAYLLAELDKALIAFSSDLKQTGDFKDVLIVTFSEFGRRVAENDHRGTDHGAANNMFVISGALKKSGIYNELPDLEDLDEGDIKHSVDFRQVYATVLERWLNVDANSILGRQFKQLSFV